MLQHLPFEDTKSCCYLAYDARKGQKYRFWDGSVWDVVDTWITHINGFKAILLRRRGSLSRLVLAFAGTDSPIDAVADLEQVLGLMPMQYPQALAVTMLCRRKYPKFYLCGHSLGGGLAAFSSVKTRLPASTINPAPLVGAADFSAFFGNHSQIVNYIAGGSEFVSSSPGRNPGIDKEVPAVGNFFTRHSIANVNPKVPLPVKV
jgi:hypothetical protein